VPIGIGNTEEKRTSFMITGEKCQETGEKFQPIGGKRKNYDKDLDEESDDDQAGSDVDSLSDLYPGRLLRDTMYHDFIQSFLLHVLNFVNPCIQEDGFILTWL
jgi:hypothetical protein